MLEAVYRKLFFFIGGLLAVAPVFSQAEQPDSLQQKFVQFQLNNYQEKVFVHTNKTFYLAGEIAWFKAYNIDGYLHKPSVLSSIVNIELIDNEQRPVLQARVLLHEGSGAGSLLIPTATPSGVYRLRAYTSWMKNFSPGFYFEQSLVIVNTLKEATVTASVPSPVYQVQFFPEGGNLVAGLPSKMAFKIVNNHGQGVAGNGVIIDAQKNTVAKFETLHAGMGNFLFTPEKDKQYRALITIGDTSVVRDLPEVYRQGYTMQLTDAGAGKLQVTVFATTASSAASVYLLVHTRQIVKSLQGSPITGGRAVFSIDKNVLGAGISVFTIFNPERHPVCERLYFKRPAIQLKIDAKTDQAVYDTRKKVVVTVLTEDEKGPAADADLSVAVFAVDSMQPATYTDICSYLLLSSDLKGPVDNPGYYFTDNGPQTDAAADNLMLTQGWRRFRWQDALANRPPLLEYLPEKEGPVINARLTDKRTGRPATNVTAYLSVPGPGFVLTSAVANAGGELRFNTSNFYGRNEIIAQTDSRTDSTFRIDITGAYSDKFSDSPFPAFDLPEQWKSQLEYRSINMQVDNSYRLQRKEQYLLPSRIDTTMFYGRPDKQYYLDDYTRFTTMEEVMREYVTEVRVRKQADKFIYRVYNDYFKVFFDDDPMVLIDGVPVFDLGKIMALDPLRVKKMDIITSKHYLGGMTGSGIISYKTYTGDLGGYPLDPNAVVVEYDGLQREREFYAPVYETAEQSAGRLPDTRNALWWDPHVKTGSTGKTQVSFYTSDLKGQYVAVIQGLSSNGLPGSTIINFTVR